MTPAARLPGCLVIALPGFLPLLAPDLIERCNGLLLPESPGGKGGAMFYAALATLWARRWIKAHQAHWDVVRAAEPGRSAAHEADRPC